MYRVVGRRAERLLTVSEFSRRELSTVLAVDPDRFVVAPNGVEHSEGPEADQPVDVGNGLFVLMVGPPAAHKNIAPVAMTLARRGIDVVVVGRAAHRVFRGAGGTGVQATVPDRIRWLGRVSDAQMRWLYRHASALVFPSLYEGFGLPVVEAQRLGCPVVASDRASLPEVAGHGAVLVDPTDPGLVAEKVALLLTDAEARNRLAVLGRANADRFPWATTADRIAETLADLRGLRRPSGQR
jgi:glycosyltransferase involved in cell wall biosynthesis